MSETPEPETDLFPYRATFVYANVKHEASLSKQTVKNILIALKNKDQRLITINTDKITTAVNLTQLQFMTVIPPLSHEDLGFL